MDVAELLDVEEAYLPKNLGPRPAIDSIKIYLRKDGLWSPGVEMQQTFKMLKMEEVELSMDQVGMIPFRMALSLSLIIHVHVPCFFLLWLQGLCTATSIGKNQALCSPCEGYDRKRRQRGYVSSRIHRQVAHTFES